MSLETRVASRYLLTQKVAQRVFARGLELNKIYQNPKIRVHRYRDHYNVQDLTFAGKRGKRVPELIIGTDYSFVGGATGGDAWLEEQALQMLKLTRMANPYKEIKSYYEKLAKEVEGIRVEEHQLRGVDVEPYGQVYEFSTTLEDGKSQIRVKVSPIDFRVRYHSWMTRGEKGGFFQDTSFWPSKKADAIKFYGWVDDNIAKVMKFKSMDDFRKIWSTLGVNYDSH